MSAKTECLEISRARFSGLRIGPEHDTGGVVTGPIIVLVEEVLTRPKPRSRALLPGSDAAKTDVWEMIAFVALGASGLTSLALCFL
jgi:hypothetical protein